MKICKACGGIAEWNSYFGGITCTRCGFVEKPKPTNAERFRSKSDEELAEMFSHLCCPNALGGDVACNAENKGCYECWLDWFKEESEE